MNSNTSWSIQDLGNAMRNAVFQHGDPRFTRERNNKILCNGFWRKGNKQNVCVWPETATWKDIKTDEGGGCKQFALHVFNLSLPEFMERYGTLSSLPIQKPVQTQNNKIFSRPLSEIWKEILKNKTESGKVIDDFLEARGFLNPRSFLGSGYAALTKSNCSFFSLPERTFLLERLNQGPQLLVPIRGVDSERVGNIFVRNISPTTAHQKSRLLPERGGWHDQQGNPRAFGFPHLIHESEHLILFEGMADYFAGEYLLNGDHKFLPLGVPSASFFPKWAELLVKQKYPGQVTIVYQLDRNNGRLSINATGIKFGAEALKILRNNRCKAIPFDWVGFVEKIHSYVDLQSIGDIADICRAQIHHNVSFSLLNNAFLGAVYEKR